MKATARIGANSEIRFVVEADHAIDFADDRMPLVLSTPWLIWFLEHTARDAVLPLLEDAESTVGVQLDIQHLAATPVGHEVTCKARIIQVDATLLTFQLEAHDQHERIARGLHKLRVIDVSRFAARVASKRNQRSI